MPPLSLAHLLERVRRVAAVALAAQCAVVHVIIPVAGETIRGQCDFSDAPDSVAGAAIKAAMGPSQRVTGLRVVIEPPSRPAIRVVTERTIRPEAPLVMLVPVARGADERGILEPQ